MVMVVRGGFGMVEEAETHGIATSRTRHRSHLGKRLIDFARLGQQRRGQRLAHLF